MPPLMRDLRLLAILIRLQLRSRLTAEALAKELEVSVRTIYRDVDRLSAAGVPVYGDKGHGGGFSLLDGYRLQLTGLHRDEAEAMMLIGLPGLAAQLGLGESGSRLMAKLMAALPERLRGDARRIEGRIHVDPADWYRAAESAPCLATLARAVFDQRVVSFEYSSWKSRRQWQAQPLGLVMKGGAWYLVALAKGRLTTFRASQIHSPTVCAQSFDHPAKFELSEYWQDSIQRFEASLRPSMCKVQLSREGARRLSEVGAYAAQAVSAGTFIGRRLQVELPIENFEQAARLLAGLGAEFTVIGPPALQTQTRRLARQILHRHRRSQ